MQYREDYDKLTDWEKRNYIVIYKDEYMKDNDGNFILDDNGDKIRDAYRVPVRDTLKAVKNLTENLIDYSFQKDPNFRKIAGEFLLSTAEDFSPINLSGKNFQEKLQSIGASLNPVIKTPMEFATGKDFFRHQQTVPDYINGVKSGDLPPELQYKINTPSFYKWLGKTTGQSPLLIEKALNDNGGKIFTQFISKDGTNVLSSKFKKSPYLKLDEEEIKMIEDMDMAESLDKVARRTKAVTIWDNLKGKNIDEQRRIITELKSKGELDQRLFDELKSVKQKDTKKLGKLEYSLLDLEITSGARAKAMVKILADKTPEERKELLLKWKDNEVLTKKVWLQYQYLTKKQ
jgi:hypothetical protein